MDRIAAIAVAVLWCIDLASGQTINDPARIDIYVTPYYNSKGPGDQRRPV
jgi:hypothetical protein